MNKKWLAAMPGALLPARFAAMFARSPAARARPCKRPGEAGQAGVAQCAVALAALLGLGWFASGIAPLPQPLPADAPAARFSAARAFAHVQALARAPRPVASASNKRAREYIIERLRALGLSPDEQKATMLTSVDDGFRHLHVTLATVRNVVVRIDGTAVDHDRRPALLLVSHYDSGVNTLGAADGGASSAAMLETLRALRAGPPPRYDVVFLFADAEKIGSLGARAFVEQHPLARRIGLALQFDNAGNRGPVVLYDTRHAGSEAIAGWARSAARPRGSSLTGETRKLRPGALRIGPLAALDAPVLMFANLDGDSGTPDTPERLDRGTLQQEGDMMLDLAREFSARPLAGGAQAGQVFFALPPFGVVHYPAKLIWPLTRLACLLLVGVCCLAHQRARITTVSLVQGAFAFPPMAFGLALGAWALWEKVPGVHRIADHSGNAQGLPYLLAVALLATGLFVLMQRGLQSLVGAHAAALGALACIAIMLALVSWAAPGASFLLAWPLLAALCALAALHSRRVAALPGAGRLAIAVAGAAPAMVLFAPALRDAFTRLPAGFMNLPMTLLGLLLGLCVLPLALAARRFAVRALLLAGLSCLAAGSTASPSRYNGPQPDPLVYYQDMPTWRAWWIARPPELDSATRQLFPNLAARRRLVEVFGWDSDDLWYSPAPRSDVAFPHAIELVNEGPPHRRVEFVLTSRNRAPEIELWLKGAKPKRVSVNGRVVTAGEYFSWSMSLYGMDDQALHFQIDLMGDPIAEIRVEERIPGLPAQSLPPQLAESRAFLPMTGMTIAADELLFR